MPLPAHLLPTAVSLITLTILNWLSAESTGQKCLIIRFTTVQWGNSNGPSWSLCLWLFEHSPLLSWANRSGRDRVGNQEILHSIQPTDHKVSLSHCLHNDRIIFNLFFRLGRESPAGVFHQFIFLLALSSSLCLNPLGDCSELKPSEAEIFVSEN